MSTDNPNVPINPPSLPKGGGTLQGTGKGWANVGASGTATFEIPLPISPARGYVPTMALTYHSTAGNGPFGTGWAVQLGVVSRSTSKRAPAYTAQDTFTGPDAQTWLPERGAQGATVSRQSTVSGTVYSVTQYFPRIESSFDVIQHWQSPGDTPGFWLIQGADGSQHLYGKTPLARIVDPDQPQHVAQWLLQESLNAHGEHIYYHYKQETDTTRYPRDCRAQHYLQRVCYGNFTARKKEQLYLWTTDDEPDVGWHFQLLFDYGERAVELDKRPTYAPIRAWPVRDAPWSDFSFGFELRTLRLCRQILMYHHFPDETNMGADPVLVRRLVLEYNRSTLLSAVHDQGFDSSGNSQSRPPLECVYQSSLLKHDAARYQSFGQLPGLNDGYHYQLVDLYGEGIPGILYRTDKSWYYREPLRDESALDSDSVTYGVARELSQVPIADSTRPVHQALADLKGDGRLDWLVAHPGMCGFFSLDKHRNWSTFTPFDAFPTEFFHAHAIMADLMGAGRHDFAMIGPRSVRLYANRRKAGFAIAIEVPHATEDPLPSISGSPNELVAFSDVLATGQQHLIRVRHDEVRCWPNLGRGRFAKSFVMAVLPFSYRTFKAANVRLADLAGTGATDLMYLTPDHLWIFLNKDGNNFETTPIKMPWPPGIVYDDHCQASIVDVQGLGCPSLILTAAHQTSIHWRYDFFRSKPWMLIRTYNNMGAHTSIKFRSSAQEWLDEKRQLNAAGQPVICHLPFAIHLVSRQTQSDDITGNRLTQQMHYRHGYYDRADREFRGFGLLLQTDTESSTNEQQSNGFSAPVLSKTWFHTGQFVDMPTVGASAHDPAAKVFGPTLVSRHQSVDPTDPFEHYDDVVGELKPALAHQVARALSGMELRTEVMAADAAPGAVPYSVQIHRYLVRELAPMNADTPYARLLPLPLESISYRYEGVADDPVCQHHINLRRDAYGCLVHGVTLHYARRTTHADSPPAVLLDKHQQRWWRDTHDAAQQSYYVSETLAQYIHLTDSLQWRLALPYRQRSNALVLGKSPAAGGLSIAQITYEAFVDHQNGPLAPNATRDLIGLSVQHYREPGGHGQTLAPGIATFQALTDCLETAELDKRALDVYKDIPAMPNQPSVDLAQKLRGSGYQTMNRFFLFEGETSSDEDTLWSVRRHFPQYGNATQFYRLKTLQMTRAHGRTTISYDPYWLQTTLVVLPDGCMTKAEYDYRSLLPNKIVDPNNNVQEALYDGFGLLLASTFHGYEQDVRVGFSALADYSRPKAVSPAIAIADAKSVLQKMASAHCYDPFSWMGTVDNTQLQDEWVAKGYLLPGGHIRMTARLRLRSNRAPLSDSEKTLKRLIDTARQAPVHGLMMQADRYPEDTQQKIRMTLTCWDGFGRTLQSKQKTEPGLANAVDELGNLLVEEPGSTAVGLKKQLRQVQADPRWRVSERVEYNNKGLVIRTYRPYFADKYGYINDQSLRELGYSDRQFYDPLGRPTRTLTAAGFMRRTTYWAWYTVNEDENDTYEDVEPSRDKPAP